MPASPTAAATDTENVSWHSSVSYYICYSLSIEFHREFLPIAIPSNGITPEAIRSVMPPYHRATPAGVAWPPAPNLAWSECRPLERELAVRKAELRAIINAQQQEAPAPRPDARFESFRTDPLNREPTASPGQIPAFESSRTDPLNREPATPGPNAAVQTPRINPSTRGPAATPAPDARFESSRTDPLNREPATPGANAAVQTPRANPPNREPAATSAPDAAFDSSRTDPLNREPTATRGQNLAFESSRTDPLNREPAPRPPFTPLSPTNAIAVPSPPAAGRGSRTRQSPM